MSKQHVKILGQKDVQFEITEHKLENAFLTLPFFNSVVLGNSFIRKYNIEASPG